MWRTQAVFTLLTEEIAGLTAAPSEEGEDAADDAPRALMISAPRSTVTRASASRNGDLMSNRAV